MEAWEAAPLVGVNGVVFGMPRAEVREALKMHFIEFNKNKFSQNTSDDFGVAHVYYDADDLCEAIEVFPEVNVSIAGRTVFPGAIENALAVVPDLAFDGNGYVSTSKSVGIIVEGEIMASILFGIEGYFA